MIQRGPGPCSRCLKLCRKDEIIKEEGCIDSVFTYICAGRLAFVNEHFEDGKGSDLEVTTLKSSQCKSSLPALSMLRP